MVLFIFLTTILTIVFGSLIYFFEMGKGEREGEREGRRAGRKGGKEGGREGGREGGQAST